ncbi:MAG: polyhydroxyalkanoate depolymerase [Alphaproteobacteria bacterium]|nr:polyhydroxyalkanoate depolymerase [Alphaproteobacteria bacterium]
MLYHLYELQHAVMTPVRLQAEVTRMVMQNPWNPLSYTQIGRTISANAEMIERSTRRFGRPEFGLVSTQIGGQTVTVEEKVIVEKPFGRLLNFKRQIRRRDPKVLIVAPMSGHYATLLRGTVEALLPHHDVYITDWEDARQVPITDGRFSLDTYITYLREFLSLLGPDTHLIAVCQPAVPVLATVSLMASERDPNQPLSMTLMGGPVDTRVSKTTVTELAENRPLTWFEKSVIHEVPFYYPGAFRKVYPGFLQLGGFMSMNLDRHVGSHMKFYHHLIMGDGESAEAHRKFYNEYLSVMDIPAEFYLQTVETVFIRQLLPRGRMKWRDPLTDQLLDVRPQDIEHTALLTIEGELDDISARGQTTAAHELCYNLSQRKQYHHFQLATGHYGIFNGRRWRDEIMPRIRNFIRMFEKNCDPIPEQDLEKTGNPAPAQYNRDEHGIAAVRRWLRDNRSENYKELAH